MNEAMARIAEFFLGRIDLAMPLDQSGRQQLRLDLTLFDCMLFVEQLLAIVSADSFDAFAERTHRLRYRNGEISYRTRQHYFHDWVGSAQLQGVLEAYSAWPGLPRPGSICRSISCRAIAIDTPPCNHLLYLIASMR